MNKIQYRVGMNYSWYIDRFPWCYFFSFETTQKTTQKILYLKILEPLIFFREFKKHRKVTKRLKLILKEIQGAAVLFIIFWDFLMFYQIFFSPGVKRSVIIISKHNIYELLIYEFQRKYDCL